MGIRLRIIYIADVKKNNRMEIKFFWRLLIRRRISSLSLLFLKFYSIDIEQQIIE